MNAAYTITEIASIVGGEIINAVEPDLIITQLQIDSRIERFLKQSLFFCLVTERNDGHYFIQDAYNKGARNFIISNSSIKPFPSECNIILVSDTLKALQDLAAFHRDKFDIPIIGITGSNGKTVVKEWLYQLLSIDKVVTRSPKSYNSQIGVPLSVWQLNNTSEIGIFEAGISKPDEMKKIQQIIKPTIGVFTNIGQAHNENFIHKSQKIGEKLNLFTQVETLIYCADYADITERIIKSELNKKVNLFSWSKNESANVVLKSIQPKAQHTIIQLQHKLQDFSIEIPFTDKASIENCMHCIGVMLYLNYSIQTIQERLKQLLPVAMRLEVKEGINYCTIINDSYNSDITSLEIALDFMNQQQQHQKKSIIISDILQSGKNENELYQEVANLLLSKNLHRVIGIGPSICRNADKFKNNVEFFTDTLSFIKKFDFNSFNHETILLKGARVFEFEQIMRFLQQKTHETVMEINLEAIANNLKFFRSKLRKETQIMVMVKAFSYGSGSFEIANVLQFYKVNYLAVAYIDEGVELRRSGITIPIIVMNPEFAGYDNLFRYNLEPEIYSFNSLHRFIEAYESFKLEKKESYPIHLKLDTGMHRLGFEPEDIEKLIGIIQKQPNILIKSVFSHLAAADEPENDNFTLQQIDLFEKMSHKIINSFQYPILRHILNSTGIERFIDAQFDMVRLGIGLYGISNCTETQSFLQNVASLKTTISQIKHIKANESVGYGRKALAKKDLLIAVIPIGYADGLRRTLGNGNASFYVNGIACPTVGNICMDMCMIDISNVNANVRDEVEIFGKYKSINQLALEMQTIPYEVLTSISRRVKRVYYKES